MSMKTSGTLQSIRSIASSQSADGSQVRFNRFTGKAIVMGSSGSRFGLVSWVRKLYTTSSNKKVQRFLMDGIAKEHRNNENLKEYLQDKLQRLAPGSLKLWTVSDVKLWNEGYTSSIEGLEKWKKRFETRLADGNKRIRDVLPEVTDLMRAFNEESDRFVAGVSQENGERFYQNHDDHVIFPYAYRHNTKRDDTIVYVFRMFPKENKDVYCAAVLKDVKGRYGNVLPELLNTYVKGVSGRCEYKTTAKAAAEDYFHQWLSREFIKSVVLEQADRIKSAREDAQGGLICPEKAGDGEVNSHRENLGIRVKKLLDMHYRIEEREDSSEEGGKKASFHEELQKDGKLRGEAEARLRTKYIAHNKNLTKTVYISGTFLEHLPPEYVNKSQRSAFLDTVLLQELDQIFADYQSKETP